MHTFNSSEPNYLCELYQRHRAAPLGTTPPHYGGHGYGNIPPHHIIIYSILLAAQRARLHLPEELWRPCILSHWRRRDFVLCFHHF
jgi:hypothetical protein